MPSWIKRCTICCPLLEPSIDKGVGFCLHLIRETVPRCEEDSLEALGYSRLGILVSRRCHYGTNTVYWEQGIGFSCRQQEGSGGHRRGHHVQVAYIEQPRHIGREPVIDT